jgi:DNA primase
VKNLELNDRWGISLKVSEEIIQKVKDGNDIVEIISETVKLRRAGRNYAGLCPFHHEKTPSFSVSSDKQIYKCFGCGEAGNVVTFVMKSKNLPFMEALRFLADRINLTIETKDSSNKELDDKKEKLYTINVESARYFFKNLQSNQIALEYFRRRGIADATIKKFGLGYSLEGWNNLINYLKRKGYTELDLISAGVVNKRDNGGIYDKFRNRVMFPIFDYKGKVIGFGGRVLDDSKPKYLNSPETLIFNKGINLYGLNFAVKSNTERYFIIVEGYMDCISLHQYGITNVVASLGTALTPSQAKLLKRYADKVIISYDADLAGQAATMRGLDILRNEGFDVRVLTVPSGKDPDEYIRSNGKDAFMRLANEAMPLIEYRIKRAKDGIDFTKDEMIIQYTKKVTEILADLDPVEKDVYIKKISEDTGIKEQAIYDLLKEELQKNVNKLQNVNIVENFGQKLYVEPAYLKAERSLLKFMLKDGESYNYIVDKLNPEVLNLESHKKIFHLIAEAKENRADNRVSYVEAGCSEVESSKEWVNIINLELIDDEYDIYKLIDDYINEVKKYKLEESKKEIMMRIKEYEAKGLIEESMKLAKQFLEIKKEIGRG